jgi:hypothetical protein
MGIEAAVAAYRDSKFDSLHYNQDMRIGSRSMPIIGGLWSALKIVGNGLFRPVKVGSALLFGYEGKTPAEPPMPPIPEEFKNTELGADFEKSWKARSDAIEKRVEAFGKLMGLDITGWMRASSIAAHNEVIDRHKFFPEEGEAMAQAASADDSRWVGRVGGELAAKALTGILGGR